MKTLISWIYGLLWASRATLYRWEIFKTRTVPARVICVGNLTTGGTGKTPMVIALAGQLKERGRKVAIVSRGYRGKGGKSVVIVSDGVKTLVPWEVCGDEPLLMAESLPGVPVLISSDRWGAGKEAIRSFSTDTLILDDGFQHFGLHRDWNLLLIDATDPFGGGKLLPAGRLREPLTGIRRAHGVVLTRTDSSQDLSGLIGAVRGYNPEIPVYSSVHEPSMLRDTQTHEPISLNKIKGHPVIALSGIGNPDAFRKTLLSLDARIFEELVYPDHHRYTHRDLEKIRESARRHPEAFIVTTEKDWIRLRAISHQGLPIVVLSIQLQVLGDGSAVRGVDTIIDRMMTPSFIGRHVS